LPAACFGAFHEVRAGLPLAPGDVVQDRSTQVLGAAETVASWARARRAAWNAALVPDPSSREMSSEPAAPEEEQPDERPLSVSEMLESLVMNAEFRKNLDQ
jgi:hypothetical protein